MLLRRACCLISGALEYLNVAKLAIAQCLLGNKNQNQVDMRATDTLTISLPAAIAKQMKKVQKKENRTRSELLRDAWRQYFESHYGSYTPTRPNCLRSAKAAQKSAAAEYERSRMSSMTWTIQIAKRAEKQLAKTPAKSRGLLLAALEEMQQNPFQRRYSSLESRALGLASAGWSLSNLLRCLSRIGMRLTYS